MKRSENQGLLSKFSLFELYTGNLVKKMFILPNLIIVLSRLGVERGLLSQIRTHKLSYFGHIARHDSLQKIVLTGENNPHR